MSCYVIAVGGTGVRVLKSIVYLGMAGCFDDEKLKVMCVDSDESNGDVKKLEELLIDYNNLCYTNIFPEITPAVIDKTTGRKLIWSPLSTKGVNTVMPMKAMVGESLMSDKAQKVLKFLYTKGEREKVLEGGFYGHTSIGSYFMSQQIREEDGSFTTVWKDYFSDLNDATDKIFIIGSIFGGTGASGVPTIARILRENPTTKDIPIGAIFVQPYFKPVMEEDLDRENLEIDWTAFTTKTKTALSYYIDQEYNTVFNTMYFIGEDYDKFMTVKNNDCGNNQINKANAIEIFAATALLDFLKDNISAENFTTKFTQREEKIVPEMLNVKGIAVFEKMTQFFKLSVLFSRYYYNSIVTNETVMNFGYSEIDIDTANKFKGICDKYVAWLREIVVKTDAEGDIDYKNDNNDLALYNSQLEELFSEQTIAFKPKGKWIFKTQSYDYEELDCMKDMIKTAVEPDMTGLQIMEKLSDLNGKGGLKALKDDFYQICI